MEYAKLGTTGVEVSRICLGCMTFGDPQRGTHAWTLPEEPSRNIIRQAFESGINFLDTANVYSDGSSEEIVGRAIRDFSKRDDVVLATKVHGRMRPGPNGAGLSRRTIFSELDNSLRRLGTDYVDLYQIHRWDRNTPIEETLEALHDVRKAGKVRYIGASSMFAWQFAKSLYTSRLHKWAEFVTMQNHLNLLNREEEREMLPLCLDQGIGLLPWSPLARGKLTRPWDQTTERAETDVFGKTLYGTNESDRQIVARVLGLAQRRNVPPAQVALAWVAQKPGVTAPIIGASKPHHLTDALAALELNLTPEEIKELEAPYTPHVIAGFQ